MMILQSLGGGVDPAVAKALGAAYQPEPNGRTLVGNTLVWDFMGRALAARA